MSNQVNSNDYSVDAGGAEWSACEAIDMHPTSHDSTHASSPDHDAAFKFDRRRHVRRAAGGHVSMLRRGRETLAYRQRICSIQLHNISDCGLGARTDQPIAEGESVAIFFPPHGPEQGFDLYGHVQRCTATDDGYQVGIQFDLRPAA
jgi:hypothetical protein